METTKSTFKTEAELATPDNIQAVQGNLIDFIGRVAKELEGAKK